VLRVKIGGVYRVNALRAFWHVSQKRRETARQTDRQTDVHIDIQTVWAFYQCTADCTEYKGSCFELRSYACWKRIVRI